MLIISGVLLTFAVLGGAVLASLHLAGRDIYPVLSAAHGIFAVAGAVFFLVYLFQQGIALMAGIILVLLLGAAGGGLLLLGLRLSGRNIPVVLVLLHGAAGLTGFILLVFEIIGKG